MYYCNLNLENLLHHVSAFACRKLAIFLRLLGTAQKQKEIHKKVIDFTSIIQDIFERKTGIEITLDDCSNTLHVLFRIIR